MRNPLPDNTATGYLGVGSLARMAPVPCQCSRWIRSVVDGSRQVMLP